MYVCRLLCVTALLAACLSPVDASASTESLPLTDESTLVTNEALEALPLAAPLVVSEENPVEDAEPAPMIPEPAGLALIGGGLLAMVALRRRFG